MRKILLLLISLLIWATPLCLIPSLLFAAEARFTWTPNTESSLAGYKIYHGTESGKYTTGVDQGMGVNIAGKVTGTVGELVVGTTYYFAATAYDTDGFESLPSTEVTWKAHERLNAPTTFYVAPEKKLTIILE